MQNERDRILAELEHELTTPRPDHLKDDKDFIKEMRNKIGSLLCQAEDLGKADFDYITARLPMPRSQSRELIKVKRAYDFIEKNVLPLIKRWDAAFGELREESHRLDDGGQTYEPSQKWSDLMNEILQLAREIDRKTAHLREYLSSYIEKTSQIMQGSVKLAYPENAQALRSTRRFFRNMPR